MVSIITSVYNEEKYIDEMINSVLEQTYDKWELIIIDDASTDLTYERIVAYDDPRIIIYRNDKNQGLTYNLNMALKFSKGDYIFRIDGDDIMMPDRLEKQIDYMENNPDVGLLGGWAETIGKKNTIMRNKTSLECVKIDLLYDAAMIHPSFCMRKSTIDKFGLKYDEKYRYAQDYALEFEFSKHSIIVNAPMVVIKYRTHNEQISVKRRTLQQECANEIRKSVLAYLGVVFDEKDNRLWLDFCNGKKISKGDLMVLRILLNTILESNKNVGFFDVVQLERSIKYRFLKYESLNEMSGKELFDSIKISDSVNGIKKVAIYGASIIGIKLAQVLSDKGVEISYFIDRDSKEFAYNIYTLADRLDTIDAIFITPFMEYDTIYEEIRKVISVPIISIEDFIYS